MTQCIRTLLAGVLVSGIFLGVAAAASAQTSRPQPVVVEVPEPDFSLINLPTTRELPQGKSSFHLTHRFLGNLRQNSFSTNLGNVFGLDNGAMVGLEYRVALTNKVQAVFYRTSVDKTIQFSARFDAIRQTGSVPVSLTAIVSIEGNHNFGLQTSLSGVAYKSPAVGAVISRTFEHVAVYAVPMFVHNSVKLADDTSRDTFTLGTGARIQVRPTVYLVGDVAPRLSGYAPGPPVFGFGIEKRAGWHMFQLNFSNSTSTTFGQLARGGFPTTIYLGFNLGRKFL
jgi:hypothetical protein